MLTLYRESRIIVTDSNFSFKLKCVNPCCYMDSIPGDVGLGLEITVNEYTRTEFGNPDRFEKFVTGQDRKFPNVSIRFGGFVLIRGTLIITDASHETYSGWLQSDLGVLGTTQRDKFITEMPWPVDQSLVNDGSHTRDYDFTTVQNPAFWEGKGKSQVFTLDYTDEFGNPAQRDVEQNKLSQLFWIQQNSRVNRMNGVDHTVLTDGDACVVSPFLKLSYVIAEMLRMNGFFLDEFVDFDFASLLVYHNFNIFSQEFTGTNTPIKTFDQNTNEWIEVTVTQAAYSFILTTFNYANLLPKIAMKDAVLSVQNLLNIAFHFKTDRSVKVIDRNQVPNAEAYDLDRYFLGHWKPGERKDVRLKFKQTFDDNDDLKNDWHDLSDRLADFGDPVADIPALKALPSPQLGELRVVTSLNKIYEYKWATFDATDEEFNSSQTDVLEWVFVSIANLQPYVYGTSDEEEVIETKCSTLAYNTDNSLIFPESLYTRQKGNIYSAKSLWADFGFRVIYMRDYYNVQKGYLEFGGANGLFKRRWEKWARMWKNRLPVEGEFLLPVNELYYVINNITQPFSTRHGKFIIEEMECDFQGALMGTVRIRGYKL